MSSGPSDELFLDDVWSFYFHDPDDRDWTLDSYRKIATVSSAEEFWGVHKLTIENAHKAMFFVMREHVFPCWDDPMNIDGGCFSLMVAKEAVAAVWGALCAKMLTERLTADPAKSDVVTGLSVSPKIDFCIVKIWLKNGDLTRSADFDLPNRYSGIFTLNRAKIIKL